LGKQINSSACVSPIDIIPKLCKLTPPRTELSFRYNTLVRKLARQHGKLPESLFVQNVKRRGDTAFACGGFADVFRGALLDRMGRIKREVALKVFRVFENQSQNRKVFAVGSSFVLLDGLLK
jgi:hypothetical protein